MSFMAGSDMLWYQYRIVMMILGAIMGVIMDYISVFGAKFMAPALVLGLFPQSTDMIRPEAVAGGVNVTVNIDAIRNAKGQILLCLTQNSKAFPDCSKDASAITKIMPIDEAAQVTFTDVQPGTYAISIFHDENKNEKMDMRIFIPREGFAFSRNPKIGIGPPKFKNAAFLVGRVGVTQNVKMKYMF